jgi:putative ABC transport system ATP-binding protein
MPAGVSLEVQDLRIAFGNGRETPGTLVRIAEWTVPASSRVALCGPSGSGKTSLLNVLGAIDRPASGRVVWDSVDVARLGARTADRWRRTSVGFVFQHFHLFAGLSALENVLLPARFDHFRAPLDVIHRATGLLARVGVPCKRRVETLSRGEMQRVAIARAILRQPPIVLADEPTASLDHDTALVIIDLLLELCHEGGATLIVATHDGDLARRMDRRFDIAGATLALSPSPALPLAVAEPAVA